MEKSPAPQRSLITRVFITPDEPRLRAGWRLVVQLLLLLAILIIAGVPLSLLAMIFLPLDTSQMLVLSLLISGVAVTLSVYLARRFLDRRSFASLGLHLNRQTIYDFSMGMLIAGLMMGLIYLLEWAFGWLRFDWFAWQVDKSLDVWIHIAGMFFFFVIVAWQEELLNRGYWLQNVSDGLNLFWGVLISSLVFAFAHLQNPSFSWNAFAGLVLAGVFLAYAYLRSGQLWLSIGLHLGWNFFEGTVFGFPVSGLSDLPVLVLQRETGPDMLTGGAFGPEAGLILLPALALGAILIRWYTRKRDATR